MPFKPLSVAALVCERILQEGDTVFSAIRIVDLFYVPPNAPAGSAKIVYVLVMLKTTVSNAKHRISIVHEPPNGPATEVGSQEGYQFTSNISDESVPVGFSVAIELSVALQLLGTHNVRVLVDGDEVGRAYFTFMQRPETPAKTS
jgi:hypothetical protein